MMQPPRKRAALAMRERINKHQTTLCARCALFGLVLNVLEDDHGKPLYVATRWAITRSFSSLQELEKWLDKLNKEAR